MEKLNKTYGVYDEGKNTLKIYKRDEELPIKGYVGSIARQMAAALSSKGLIIIAK